MATAGLGCMDFYSAREKPEPVQPLPAKTAPAKKAGAKRPTNAPLAEQVTALTAQMQLLLSQQKTLRSTARSSGATPAPVHVHGTTMPPALPPVSAGMANVPMACLARTAKASGPPSRARPPVNPPLPDVLDPEIEDGPFQAPADHSVVQGIMQQSQALTALVSHLVSHIGSERDDQFRAWVSYKRRCTQREDAARASFRFQHSFPSGPTADLPEKVSSKAAAKDRARVDLCRCFHDGLSGEIWRVQGEARSGSSDVDGGSLHGCRVMRRYPQAQGVSGHHNCVFGTSNDGRQLADSIRAQPFGGTSEPTFLGTEPGHVCFGETFLPPDSCHLVGHSLSISEGSRPAFQQESRDQRHQKYGKAGREHGEAISETQAKVPQEAKARGRDESHIGLNSPRLPASDARGFTLSNSS